MEKSENVSVSPVRNSRFVSVNAVRSDRMIKMSRCTCCINACVFVLAWVRMSASLRSLSVRALGGKTDGFVFKEK